MDLPSLRAYVRRRLSREEAVGLYFTASLLACLILLVAIGVLGHEVLERGSSPAAFDAAVGGYVYGLRSPRATRVLTAITFLGDARFLVVATGVVVAALFRAGRRVSALLFLGSVAGGLGLETALKIAYARARPDLWPALVRETTYSFPSGHATMSTVFFGGLAAVVFHLTARRGPRIASSALAAAVSVSVAISRVYLGAHWATDTFAGVLVGLFWVVVFAAGTEYLSRRR